MSSTSVSVVVPLCGDSHDSADVCGAIERYLVTTGFTFEIVTASAGSYGSAVRKGVSEAKGTIIVVVDARLPYRVEAIGDAVALVDSGTAEVVFAASSAQHRAPWMLRTILVDLLPDRDVLLAAFSNQAGKIIVSETALENEGVDLEIAFLANKYGFRVEHLVVGPTGSHRRSYDALDGVLSAIRVRMANRRNAYRAPRRCPVCFSYEVWTRAQVPGNVIRACRRCKCRYLNQFIDEEGLHPARKVFPANPPAVVPAYETHSPPAREKTSLRRLVWVRRQIPARARVLEVGVRDGSFGSGASRDYEYVGIDPVPSVARHARSRGLEVYCASLSSFVNVGAAFDAITLFHVFENIADPHDALGRIKDLLKPGGVLFLSTFDTEGLIYLATERKRMTQNFRTHLILYSRSALIELLEHSGFEIIDIGPDFEYRDQKLIRHWFASHHPLLAPAIRVLMKLFPDPMIISSGSIRIIARRRAGMSANVRAIRAAEPTHAR